MKITNILCFSLLILAASACKPEKDQAFCECMAAGKALNEHSQKLLEGDVNEQSAAKQRELLITKKDKCKGYEKMAGPEMQAKKEACEAN